MLGPQKEPASLGRLRAQWKQVDGENREAKTVRRLWMAYLGYSSEEIEQDLSSQFDLSLQEELERLENVLFVAIRVNQKHQQLTAN